MSETKELTDLHEVIRDFVRRHAETSSDVVGSFCRLVEEHTAALTAKLTAAEQRIKELEANQIQPGDNCFRKTGENRQAKEGEWYYWGGAFRYCRSKVTDAEYYINRRISPAEPSGADECEIKADDFSRGQDIDWSSPAPVVKEAEDGSLADSLSQVVTKSYTHMEQQEYRDGIAQMLDDLERLAKSDGCIAAAWALEMIAALRQEVERLTKEVADLNDELEAMRHTVLDALAAESQAMGLYESPAPAPTEVVSDMLKIIGDQSATEQERRAAYYTIEEAFAPATPAAEQPNEEKLRAEYLAEVKAGMTELLSDIFTPAAEAAQTKGEQPAPGPEDVWLKFVGVARPKRGQWIAQHGKDSINTRLREFRTLQLIDHDEQLVHDYRCYELASPAPSQPVEAESGNMFQVVKWFGLQHGWAIANFASKRQAERFLAAGYAPSSAVTAEAGETGDPTHGSIIGGVPHMEIAKQGPFNVRGYKDTPVAESWPPAPPATGERTWQIYAANTDDVVLRLPGGATQAEAEAAQRDVLAMTAIRKYGMWLLRYEDAGDWTCVAERDHLHETEHFSDPAEAALSLVAQLKKTTENQL